MKKIPVVEFSVEDNKIKVEKKFRENEVMEEEPSIDDNMQKLTVVIGFVDDEGNLKALREGFATWSISKENLKEHDSEDVRDTTASLFKDQLIIDLNKKNIMRDLVNDIFEKELSQN